MKYLEGVESDDIIRDDQTIQKLVSKINVRLNLLAESPALKLA